MWNQNGGLKGARARRLYEFKLVKNSSKIVMLKLTVPKQHLADN